MKAHEFVDRFFDLICISFGVTCISISSYLGHYWYVAIGIGGMLIIISSSNFLNHHCRDKLLGRRLEHK